MLNLKGTFLRLAIAIKFIFISQVFVFQNAYADATPPAIHIEIPNAAWWNKAANSLNPYDTIISPAENLSGLKTLAQVRERMMKSTSQAIHIAIQKSDAVNAYARHQSGINLIIFTTGFIRQFSNDADVLASTLGHEMAHHSLGHIDNKTETVSLISTELVNGQAIKSDKNLKTQRNELAADNAGIDYAIKAGYSACGGYRLFAYLKNNAPHTIDASVSSHPLITERLNLANELNLKTQKGQCS